MHRPMDTLHFLFAENVRHMEFRGTEAAALDEQIAEKLKRFAQQAELLQSLTRCRRVEAARRD